MQKNIKNQENHQKEKHNKEKQNTHWKTHREKDKQNNTKKRSTKHQQKQLIEKVFTELPAWLTNLPVACYTSRLITAAEDHWWNFIYISISPLKVKGSPQTFRADRKIAF